jgi:hypothetical protein
MQAMLHVKEFLSYEYDNHFLRLIANYEVFVFLCVRFDRRLKIAND